MSAARKPGFMGCLQGKGAQHFARRALHHGGPAAGFAAAARPFARRKPSFSATTSIATKPVKPCDGGVFGALNLLLKREQVA